jgi:hypothetical protein
MKTLKFLCVILLSACASGLDVNASKSDAIFRLHHLNNKNESKPVKFSLLQQLSLTTSSKQIPSQSNFLSLHWSQNLSQCKYLPLCETRTKFLFFFRRQLTQYAYRPDNIDLSILTLCCALTSSTHLLVWIIPRIQYKVGIQWPGCRRRFWQR